MSLEEQASRAASLAARDAYGRLVAWLAYQWRDLAAAQDALGDALLKALERWPVDGIPQAPETWLLSVAKRELLQAARRQRLHESPEVQALLEEEPVVQEIAGFPDARLKLMFVCAHPEIEPSARSALMLQTVLGLEARQVASAFMVSPAAMAQRLVRAKQRIALAGLRFEEPEPAQWPKRAQAVLEAIYAAYGLGWEGESELAEEALFLASLASLLMPDHPEAKGLWALMLLSEARRAARFTLATPEAPSRFVPLHEQDECLWNRAQMLQADRLLAEAAQAGQPGPFQLEAAIQAAHCHRAFGHPVPWPDIAVLYDRLCQLAPTLGALVGAAVAHAEAHGAARGWALLANVPQARTLDYAPYWVARGVLLRGLGRGAEGNAATKRAIGLTADERVKRHLWSQITS